MGLPDINLNAGQIAGLSPNELCYVYYDDPSFQGDANGPVKYEVTTDKETALIQAGRFFVGSIKTPPAGSLVSTVGNNDGGVGAQNGQTNILYPSTVALNPNFTQAGNGAVSNPTNVIDGDLTTFATFSATGNSSANVISYVYMTPPGIVGRYQSVVLKVLYSVPVNSVSPSGSPTVFGISFQTASAIPLFTVASVNAGQTVEPTEYSQTFTEPVNLAQTVLVVSVVTAATQTGGSVQVNIYDVHIEATE